MAQRSITTMGVMLSHATLIDVVGYTAATCTTVSFVPQLLRVWKLRSARDISLSMFLIFCAGSFLWLVYGACSRSWPVAIANFLTFLLALAILLLKLRFDGRDRRDRRERTGSTVRAAL